MGKAAGLSATVLLAVLASLLIAAPACALSGTPEPSIVPPQPPAEEPIYLSAKGSAVLQSSPKGVAVDAELFMAGKLVRSPWLPTGKSATKSAWIKVEKLTVKIGESLFKLSGYGTLVNGRLALRGWSSQANLIIQGNVASGNSVELSGSLTVYPRFRPLNSPDSRVQVWMLKMRGTISSQPPVRPLA